MSTHAAVVTVSARAPLEVLQVPSPRPSGDEVCVRVEWTTSGPLDLHKADGALLVKHPEVLGGTIAGTVIEIGGHVKRLTVGDQVFGMGFRSQKEMGHQEVAVLSENLLAKIPPSISMQEATTIPANLVTAFHTLTTDLHLDLPWPKPQDHVPADAEAPILVWGGSSSVGQYTIQVLHHYGHRRILAVASKRQHDLLVSLGASEVLEYDDLDVVTARLQQRNSAGELRLIVDCIGSQHGSVAPISRIATAGAVVAVMLPVIVRDATEVVAPVYEMDVGRCAEWAPGVDARGVRTHFYLANEFFAEYLQPEIMPGLVEQGVIRPNRVRVVEGETMLARAQRALDLLRRKEVSGEKLVWRVSEAA